MRKNFILILIIACASFAGQAQGDWCEIYGVVTDSTGQAVQNVNVFIPFTSKGATTNANGEYKLNKVTAGEFELVFRHIGYQAHTEFLKLSKGKRIELNIRIKSQVIQINEIVKKANSANWKFGYDMFKQYLLGDPVGRLCEVMNPKDIFFYYDGERLIGHATKPLEIENKYLGYTLIYYLDYFWFNQDKKDSNGKIDQVSFAFSGSAFYIDNSKEENWRSKVWSDNRDLEFRGTLKHFLMSLFMNQCTEEGYEVKEAWAGLKEFQASLNISPAIAYSRSMELEKRFYWDEKAEKSTNILFLRESDYKLEPELADSTDEKSPRFISLKDRYLVFHYWDSQRKPDEIRVAYLSVIPDESSAEPILNFNEKGEYQVKGGELIWHYLDNQTKLAISLPLDYVGRLKQINN